MQGGYVALADGQVAGAVLLNVDEARSVARIQDIIVGRQFRRYGIGSLLLSCASDWARNHECWAIVLETAERQLPCDPILPAQWPGSMEYSSLLLSTGPADTR